MNAISLSRPESTADERTARHLRVCQELIELGMDVARAAARVAQKDLAAQNDAATADSSPETTPRKTDPSLLFARLCSAVRQAVVLEERIASGHSAPQKPAHRPVSDPRRATLSQVFHYVTEHHPDRIEIRRTTNEFLDQQIAQDPEAEISIPNLFTIISQQLGIPMDFSTLPDALLEQILPEDFDRGEGDQDDPHDAGQSGKRAVRSSG